MVTPAQREALTTEQRAALDEALIGSRAEASDPQPHAAYPQSGREIIYKLARVNGTKLKHVLVV